MKWLKWDRGRQATDEPGYENLASENQIRKMIGNGWNVDTIAHIFGGLS